MEAPIGLIAGEGTLPVITAQGIAAQGRRVACVGLYDQHARDLPSHCDRFNTAGVVQFGRWIRLLRGWGVREAVMVGGVRKDRIYKPFFLFHQVPDWRAVRMWFGTLRHDKRTDVMLRAVADALSVEGIELVDSTQYIPEQIADAGPMTRQRPSSAQQKDIDFALPIIQQMGRLDIGQAIAVRECEVIAVEAVEGTDRLIERTGHLCPRGGWTLVKIAKPTQDMRLDVPAVGLTTLQKIKAAGGGCLALEAGKVIMLEKAEMIAAAEKAGVAIIGLEVAREE